MAAPTYAGDAYLQSQYLQYGADPTTDPKLLAVYKDLIAAHNKLVLGFDATQAKRDIAQLTTMAKTFDTIQRTQADIAETRAKSSRVTSQNFADAKIAKEKIDAELTKKLAVPTPQWTKADQARKSPPAGMTGPAAAAQELVNWQDTMSGKRLDPSNPDIGPIMNRFATEVLGRNLNEVTVDEMVNSLGQVPPRLQADFRALAEAGKTRFDDITALQQQNRSEAEDIQRMSGDYERLQAGSPGAKAIEDKLQGYVANLQPNLMRALGRSESDIAAERQLLIEQNEQVQQSERQVEEVRGLIFKTKPDPIGRLVASDEFKKWAQANSYTPGVATVNADGSVSYQPSEDDAEAVWLYNWQAKHPGRYHPTRRFKPTGAFVRVTVQDPAAREAVIKEYRGLDGKLYMKEGELVAPGEAQQTLVDGGYVPSVDYAKVGGKSYIRRPDGAIIDVETGGVTKDTVDPKAFKPGLYYGTDGSTRYLTPGDVDTADEIKTLAAGSEGAAGMGIMGDEDKTAVDRYVATSTIKPATEDDVRSKWTGVYRGRLDAMLASDITGTRKDAAGNSYGPNAISLDGGRVIIPGSTPATIEVMKVDSPRVGLRGIAAGWRKRMTDREAERLDLGQEVPVGGASPNLSPEMQQRLDEKAAAQLAGVAMAEFLGQPPPVIEPKMVTIQETDPGGAVRTVTVPADSAAARVAAAQGQDVEPVGPESQRYATADGKVYEVKSDGTTTLVKGAAAGEKTTWTPVELQGDAALVSKLQADTTRVVTPEPTVKVPGMPELPPGADVSRYGSRAVVRYAGGTEEPSFFERVGAGAADLFSGGPFEDFNERGGILGGRRRKGGGEEGPAPGGAAPGGAAPGGGAGTAPATGAPAAGTPEEQRRRSLRDVVTDIFTRGDEGYRAAGRERRAETKAAQERLAERERYGALRTTMPEDTSAALPEAPDGAATRALDAELAALDALPPDQREEARAKLLGKRFTGIPAKEATEAPAATTERPPITGAGEMATGMARDEDLLKVISQKTDPAGRRQGGLVPEYGDLARRYAGIQGLRATNQELYTTELRKIADEARERMRTRRGTELAPVLPMPGKAEGLGVETAIEGTGAPKREAPEPVTPAVTPAPAPAAAAPKTPPVTPASVRVGSPGPGSVGGLMQPPREPTLVPPRPRMSDEDKKALDERLQKAIGGMQSGPAPSPAQTGGALPEPIKPEVRGPTPAGVSREGGLREALRADNGATVDQYMRNLREANQKTPSKVPPGLRNFYGYVNGGK